MCHYCGCRHIPLIRDYIAEHEHVLDLGHRALEEGGRGELDAAQAIRDATTIKAYGLVDLSAALVDAADRYRVTFQVKNLFDQSFAAAITSGGPGGSYRYIIPRDADRYYGVTARVNF